jgi:hypothetical protein
MSAKVILRLFLALLVTLVAAYYQRKTGPTYPVKGEKIWQGIQVNFTLERDHGGPGDQPVVVSIMDTTVTAMLIYRRFPSADSWTGMLMARENTRYTAVLPHQPPAGKMEYYIVLSKLDKTTIMPGETSIVIRFKGDVPVSILIPHIVFMFLAMLLSNVAGLEALANGQLMYRYAVWTTICLIIGGMILGPIIQKFAFGDFWSGIPFGFDLTDNKTLLALLAWLLATWKGRGTRTARIWIITAAIILLLVYSIPHSIMGSELNYQTMHVKSGQ